MTFEETVMVNKLPKRLAAYAKDHGHKKGAVKVVWTDQAVELLSPLHGQHHHTCPADTLVRNRMDRYPEYPTREFQYASEQVAGHTRCTCPGDFGFFVTAKAVSRWPKVWLPGSMVEVTVYRLAPRPFTLEDAVKFGEVGDFQEALVLADCMLSTGNVWGEVLVKLLHKRRLPVY